MTRDDGITAAQRFFENKPDDLFEWLVENMDYASKPAAKRLKPEKALHSIDF